MSNNSALSLGLMTQGIEFVPGKDIEVSEVRLILAQKGNYALSTVGLKSELKTPSQQQFGEKIKLAGSRKVFETG